MNNITVPFFIICVGFAMVFFGFYLPRRFKEFFSPPGHFLPATFLTIGGLLLYVLTIIRIIGAVLVVTGIMLIFT